MVSTIRLKLDGYVAAWFSQWGNRDLAFFLPDVGPGHRRVEKAGCSENSHDGRGEREGRKVIDQYERAEARTQHGRPGEMPPAKHHTTEGQKIDRFRVEWKGPGPLGLTCAGRWPFLAAYSAKLFRCRAERSRARVGYPTLSGSSSRPIPLRLWSSSARLVGETEPLLLCLSRLGSGRR